MLLLWCKGWVIILEFEERKGEGRDKIFLEFEKRGLALLELEFRI